MADLVQQRANERSSDGAISVERRIEDGDLEPDGNAAVDGHLDQRLQLAPAPPTAESVVDGGHDGVVEGVAVDVDPEAIELGAQELLERVMRRPLRSSLPHG